MSPHRKELGEITIVDDDHNANGNDTTVIGFDQTNPIFQPPKQTDEKKKKTWKRKLMRWSVILLLIGAGVGALYVLLRVRRVNVTVNGDSRKTAQSSKSQTEVTNSDS